MEEQYIDSKLGKINLIKGYNLQNPKAILLFVHGLGSHFQFIYPSYDEFIHLDLFFTKFNYKSYAFEFYGHGKSQGIRCSIDNFDDLIEDLKNVINFIKIENPHKKIFICAESMGGAVAIKHIIDSASNINNIGGTILLSPLCGIDQSLKPSPVMISLLCNISYLLPRSKLGYTTKKMGKYSPINSLYYFAKSQSKYLYKGLHRLCTIRELYNISLWLPENIHKFNKPFIIFHGLNDKVTTPEGSKHMYKTVNHNDKELILIPDSPHCLLEPHKYDDLLPNYIYVKILEWLDKHAE